jgi:2-methylcitrate dehydratase PrpD
VTAELLARTGALLGLERFARRVAAFADIAGEDILQFARPCVLDAVACAAAGRQSTSYSLHAAALGPLLGADRQEAQVWFANRRAGLAEAAYLNSVAVSAHDLDDGNRTAVGHPGGAVVPAVLALAEHLGVEGDLRPAIAAGYEVGIRLAASRRIDAVPTMATGRWAGIAVAAAAGVLSGWSAARLADAMAHAGSLSPQLVHPDARATDGLKEGTPWGVIAGLAAWRLTAAGMPAPLQLLERQPEFDGAEPDDGASPAITETYFKRYACCRWIHPILDLLHEDPALADIDPAEIEAIEVTTFARGLSLSNDPAPATIEDAHYSFPFCTALGVLGTRDDFLPLRLETLRRPDVLRLSRLVTISVDERFTAEFPARTPGRIAITSRGRTHVAEAITARGDPILPFDAMELAAKRRALLSPLGVADPGELVPAGGPIRLIDLLPILRSSFIERSSP